MNGGIWLYKHPVTGAGTAAVQSLTGFLCSLAVAHGRSVMTILRSLSEVVYIGSEASLRCLTLLEGRAINSYGAVQQRICGALTRAMQFPGLGETCLAV